MNKDKIAGQKAPRKLKDIGMLRMRLQMANPRPKTEFLLEAMADGDPTLGQRLDIAIEGDADHARDHDGEHRPCQSDHQ